MSDTTYSEEEYQQAQLIVQTVERQKQEALARKTQAAYEALKPIVESDEYAEIHHRLKNAMAGNGGEYAFGIYANSIINFMPNLVQAVANWQPVVHAPLPIVLPTSPASEGYAHDD